MEKFSKFNDPFTGKNPFINPKYKKITVKTIILFILKLPLFILYKIGLLSVNFLIKIEKPTFNVNGLIYCNKVTEFDSDVVKTYCNNKIYFPELTSTNNTGILQHKGQAKHYLTLVYSKECIYLNGNYLKWLVIFLGNSNSCLIKCSNRFELPQLKFSYLDKEKFNKNI